jgi:hydrogenase maturation protein HypF
MQAQGDVEQIKQFIRELPKKMRPWYQIREVIVKSSGIKDDPKVRQPFKILEAPGEFPAIRPDHTLCPDCLAEINSANKRRYAYPYWSCSKFGPSYSVMLMYPFTRRNTVFSAFPPCKKCEEERRQTGAELLACPDCGPLAFLLDRDRNIITDSNCFCEARKLLSSGFILALQTLYGSFQLLCRSSEPEAIRTLRERKKIPYLPLTVIEDGYICADSLKRAGKDDRWLRRVLEEKKTTAEETFLLTVDGGDHIHWIGKESGA